jgi:hypothetical protein
MDATRGRVDSAMVKAIARAHRWRQMLESGVHTTITELAAAEKINQLCRLLRLTLLAPDLVEARPLDVLLAQACWVAGAGVRRRVTSLYDRARACHRTAVGSVVSAADTLRAPVVK